MTMPKFDPRRSERYHTHPLWADWERVRTSRQSIRRVRTWRTGHVELDELLAVTGDLDDVVAITDHAARRGRGCRMTSSDRDAALRALVRIARDDQLAGRIVLERISQLLLVAARRHGDFTPFDDPVDQIVGAAWIAICSFDLDRRRGPVAPSLADDARHLAFRKARRRMWVGEEPYDWMQLDMVEAQVDVDPIVELACVVEVAESAGVERVHLDLIRQLSRYDSPATVAIEHGITPRALRYRRADAVAAVRAAIAA